VDALCSALIPQLILELFELFATHIERMKEELLLKMILIENIFVRNIAFTFWQPYPPRQPKRKRTQPALSPSSKTKRAAFAALAFA
jgi:hypothetical protein